MCSHLLAERSRPLYPRYLSRLDLHLTTFAPNLDFNDHYCVPSLRPCLGICVQNIYSVWQILADGNKTQGTSLMFRRMSSEVVNCSIVQLN